MKITENSKFNETTYVMKSKDLILPKVGMEKSKLCLAHNNGNDMEEDDLVDKFAKFCIQRSRTFRTKLQSIQQFTMVGENIIAKSRCSCMKIQLRNVSHQYKQMRLEVPNRIVVIESKSLSKFDHRLLSDLDSNDESESTIAILI